MATIQERLEAMKTGKKAVSTVPTSLSERLAAMKSAGSADNLKTSTVAAIKGKEDKASQPVGIVARSGYYDIPEGSSPTQDYWDSYKQSNEYANVTANSLKTQIVDMKREGAPFAEINAKQEKLDEIQPDGWERMGKVGSGAAKQYAGTMLEVPGYILDAAHQADRKIDSHYAQKEIEGIEEGMKELDWLLLTTQDEAEREKLLQVREDALALLERDKAILADDSMSYGENMRNIAAGLTQSGASDIERAKVGAGKIGSVLIDAGVGAAQMGLDVVAGLGVSAMVPMMVRSFGGGVQDARAKGYTMEQQAALGLANAATEYLSEKLFGGNPVYDSDVGLVNRLVNKLTSNEQLLAALASAPAEKLYEGLEEITASILNPIAERYITGNYDPVTIDQLIRDGAVGVITAMVAGAGQNIAAGASPVKAGAPIVQQPTNYIPRAENGAGANLEPSVDLMELARETVAEDAASQAAIEPQTRSATVGMSQPVQSEKSASGAEKAGQTLTQTSTPNVREQVMSLAQKELGEEGYRSLEVAIETASDPVRAYSELSRAYNDGLANRKTAGKWSISKAEHDVMYTAGRMDARAAVETQAKQKGLTTVYGKDSGLVYDAEGYVNSLDQKTVSALNTVAKKLGVKVQFVDSVAGGAANADIQNGIISIEKGNKNPVRFLMGHEITHRMQELAPAEYARLREAIVQHRNSLDAEIKHIQGAYVKHDMSISSDAAIDEIVADTVGEMLENEGALERFIEAHKDDRTLLEKLRDVIRDFVQRLKGSEYERQMRHVEKRLNETLRAAEVQVAQNEKTATQQGDGKTRYSTKLEVLALEGIDWMDNFSSIKQQLQKHAEEINKMEPVAVVEYTPKSAPKLASVIMDEVAKIGGKSMKRGGVAFEFDQKGVSSILTHAKTSELQAAAMASPYVAKYGKLIAGQKNHENTGLTTLTFAAPVIINDTPVNVGVVIQFEASGKPRAVNVGLQSGGVFKIDMKKAPKGLDSRISRYGQGTALPTMDASGDKVPQTPEIVKGKNDVDVNADVGVNYDAKTESVSPGKLSLKTWNASEYVRERKAAAEAMAKALNISVKKATAYIDSVNSIAKMIADDRVRLDYEASPGRSSFVSNAEYGGSIDFSTICKKRRLFTGTFEAIQKALPNTALTAEEFLEIRNMMAKKGYEVSCGLCYVEGSRANMGQYTKQFIERYKATNPAYVPNMAEMNTASGQEKIRKEHPEVYEAYEYFMNHYGRLKPTDKALFASQQKPKMYQLATEYQGEILNKFGKSGSKVEEKNRNGGLRIQSFSDFEIIHLLDSMQVIMDMSRVGLAGQAYTKVPDFAWALGDTGLKINLSLIAKGVDSRGRLILDETEGMAEADAMALRERYSENVGTIIVVFTDPQLKAAMADERIDYIIPFHRSQWKTEQYEAMGLPANAKDFTNWQNEAYIEPVYNQSGKKQRPDNYMPNNYWDFSKSGKENAEAYLKMCAENNRRPKFHYLLVDNKDGSYSLQPDGSTDGYWKTLIDFKMYDNNGKGVPQRPVRPDFNMEQAQRMLKEYEGGHAHFPAANDVVKEFVSKHKDGKARLSLKDDGDYAPVFYSHMERVLENTKQEKLGSASVVSMLRGKGVKAEEIKWSGIETFLEGKKSVTKAELLEFVRGNQVEIEEQERTEAIQYSDEQRAELDRLDAENEKLFDQMIDNWYALFQDNIPVEILGSTNMYDRASKKLDARGKGATPEAKAIREAIRAYDKNELLMEAIRDEAKAQHNNARWKDYTLNGGENYREFLFKMPGSDYTNHAMKAHWNGNTGVLAHARVQDFENSFTGWRTLFIEEIQSDWHNAGQKFGYGDKNEQIRKLEAEQEQVLTELATMQEVMDDYNRRSEQGEYIEDYYEMYDLYTELNRKYENYNRDIRRVKHGDTAVAPDAPYAKTYHEFVMKHLLRIAAEGGYDSIGWTTADIQSQRWSDDFAEGYRIEYDQDIPKFMNKYGKQWGAIVGKDVLEDGTEIWSMDITDTMRESVLYEGQPKYSLKDSGELTREINRLWKEGKKAGRSEAAIRADVRAVVDEAYQGMIATYGAIAPGEKPARDVQVPQRTEKNKRVSQTVRTVMEAAATPNEALPSIEEMVARGDFSYEVYGDEQAIDEARDYISHEGWESARDAWFDDVKKGNVSKRGTTVGWLLYDNAVNEGNTELAMNILSAMVEHQRSAAQALQATRILKKLSPETQLYGIQRSVAKLQQEINDRYKNQRGKVELKINEELAEQLMAAQSEEERAEIMADIYRDIGRQLPSTFQDKFRAWRYLAMLGNLRTHVRNVVGNAGFAPIVAAKNLTATAIESAVHRVSGGKTTRSKTLVGLGAKGRELLSAAWDDYDKVADVVSGDAKYSDLASANRHIEEGRQIFKFKPLDASRKGNSNLMEKEDAWFSKPHYAHALAQYCKVNGITAAQIRSGKGLVKAREYAAKEAQKATYRDTNAFSDAISNLRFRNPDNVVKKGVNMAAEGILPFRKTPANILVRGLEYSPLGLLNGIKQAAWDVQRGTKTSAEAIDSIAAGLTGSGLMALGAYLAAQGLIRGHGGGDDEEREFEEMMGHQSYALEVGGKSYTLDWLAPEALPFFVGVNLWEQTQGGEEALTFSDVMGAMSTVTEPMLEMSCLQSLNDVFESVGYASSNDTSGLVTVLSSAATSYLTQVLPTLLGQAERSSEGVRMTTYTDKNGKLPTDWQYTIGKATAKLTGVDYQQIPYIDAWGRTESSGGVAERSFNNFANPAYTSSINTSAMEEELLALYQRTGEGAVLPSRAAKYFTVDKVRKDLTAEEYVKYATSKGQTAYKILTSLTASEGYLALDDSDKVAVINKVYDYANALAKAEVSDYELDGWFKKALDASKNTGLKPEQFILLHQTASRIESLKDAEGESIDTSESLLIMQEVYNTKGLTEPQRKALFEALCKSKSVQHYNRTLVDQKLKEMKKQGK